MKETLNKYKQSKGTKRSKLFKLFMMSLMIFIYYFIIFFWTPATHVSILGQNDIFKFVRYGLVAILTIFTAVQLDVNYLRSLRHGTNQIKDYELWNKFFLHFAFMKTGSGSEKSQVLEILRYLEDSELKQTLTDVYEKNVSLKDAHNEIVEKYPYPQVKTFFAESEDALVKGADGNRLMQKTAINIDNYINDLVSYEESKLNSYRVTMALLSIVVLLIPVTKIFFAGAFIDFSQSYIGFILLFLFFIFIIKLIIKAKRAFNSPLLNFRKDGYE